ncbi:APC family permease [Microbacterium sp. W1N]|uniref:APC family permease n=1 Tax=Microbacterium festucae TaxID=2977531 RepID=UPI0021C1E74F|nr:APC family permease [Microbacterium festucae]MCT9819009.1 APC family permease [Microbacterium festucae]
MSALSDAIRDRRPDSTLAARSPLHGLRRGSLGPADVVAQSVAAVAPAGVLLTHAGGLVRQLGAFAFLALLATSVIVMLVALSLAIFGRRIAAAGGVYTFVTRGLGPVVGIAAGTAIAVGYGAMSIDTLRSGARRIAQLVAGPRADGPDPALMIGVVLVVGAAITAVIVVGARVSTRIMLVVEGVAVAAILTLSFATLTATGWDLAPLLPGAGAGPPPSASAFAAGIALALASFVGFESGAALAPETRRPLATVPRALIWTAAALGLIYLFGVAAQVSASAHGATGPLGQTIVLPDSTWWGAATDAVIAASWIACALACTNALVRLVFTLAREGALPAWLGAASRRFGSPHRAAAVVGGLISAGATALIVIGRDTLLGATIGVASSFGFIVAYLLLCAAAVRYLVRIGEFTLRESWPALVGAAALAMIVVVEWTGTTGDDHTGILVIVVLLLGVVGVHAWRLYRGALSPARAGAYDTPIAADAIAPAAAQKPAVRR